MEKMPPISLVIPVYNEVEVIEKVIREFYDKIISKLEPAEFIIAEDGSKDGTKEVLLKLKEEIPITLVMGEERKGYTKAVKDALKLPKYDIIFFSDSDGQQEPDDFWNLMKNIDENDIVVGYKHPRRDPIFRVFVSKVYQLFNFLIFGIKLHDINCGYRLIKKKVLDDVLDEVSLLPNFVSSEIIIRAYLKGYKIKEVPVTHYPREFGASRGLPVSRIPIEVVKLLIGLFKLKLQQKRCKV